MTWAIPSLRSEKFRKPEPPEKSVSFRKYDFWGGLGFPSNILVNKPLKALCLCFKMVYQHLLYLLLLWTYRHFKISHGPTRFFHGNFRAC